MMVREPDKWPNLSISPLLVFIIGAIGAAIAHVAAAVFTNFDPPAAAFGALFTSAWMIPVVCYYQDLDIQQKRKREEEAERKSEWEQKRRK